MTLQSQVHKKLFFLRTLRLASSFSACSRAAAAVEFVLILPFLLFFYFGVVEICRAIELKSKINRLNGKIAQIVARKTNITLDMLDALIETNLLVLPESERHKAKIIISSIEMQRLKNVRRQWSYTWPEKDSSCQNTQFVIPKGLHIEGEYLIHVETSFLFVPFFSKSQTRNSWSFLDKALLMRVNYHMRPRYKQNIECTDCVPCK